MAGVLSCTPAILAIGGWGTADASMLPGKSLLHMLIPSFPFLPASC